MSASPVRGEASAADRLLNLLAAAETLKKRLELILQGEKPKIHWKKDRGKDVESAPWYCLGPEYDGKEGDRINDHHLSLTEKKAAHENNNP